MKILLVIIFASLTTFAQTTITADRIGVNTTTPSVPLEIKVQYPANTTASEELIRFVTPTGTHNGITHHPFQFYQRSTVFGDDRTDSVGWGFAPIASPQGAPSLAFIMEDSFGTGDDANFELHIQLATPDGGGDRPWTWTFNRKTGDTGVFTSARNIQFRTAPITQPANALLLSDTEIQLNMLSGPFRVVSDSAIFQTKDNEGANMKQIRISPHPNDSGLSRLTFGDAGGVGLANINNELEVKRNGIPSPIAVGSVKVGGVKVVGAQCAAIADPEIEERLNNLTLTAILNCMRSHGLVAQ